MEGVGANGPRLLRFLTCGSVDDGKSTLIGRLLYDGQLVMDDTLSVLARDSRRHGTTGEDVDLALLMDGLEAERQQGITIDVAYRFFSSPKRSFIVADTPGHDQYTRNMATGASTSDVAVILVDARKGVLPQTRRHAYICSLFGIRDVAVAVNKMDMVDYSEPVFDGIVSDFAAFAADLGFRSVQPIPISARLGDNVWTRAATTPWYDGPHLLSYLEEIDVAEDRADAPLRLPVQWVNRPHQDFRGFSGTIASGRVRSGDEIVVAASGRTGRVATILTPEGERDEARAGDAVTLTLASEIDVSRGDVLASPQSRPAVTDQFAAHVLWMDDDPLLPGRQYQMRIGHLWTAASVTAIKHRVDVNSLEHAATRTLELNEIGFCNLSSAQRVPVDPYADLRGTGAFILVDRFTNRTAGVGLIAFSLRRADNTYLESSLVSKSTRASLNGQKPTVLWFTGLSGSGKSTIAKLIERILFEEGKRTYVLDGDNLRHGINRDLGFTDADRVENIRRVGEIAKLFVDAGLIAICSFISPFRAERDAVRSLFEEAEFVEIFVDTPMDECVRRDPKGLYAKALAGEIQNFTGLGSGYDPPENPELRVETVGRSAPEVARSIVDWLRAHGRLG